MGNLLLGKSSATIDGADYVYRIDAQGCACIEQCKATCASLRIPDTICGCPVTAIADSAFARLSNVEDVVCPCGLRHIGRHAFEGCLRLRSVSLNDGLQTIEEEAFFLCPALAGLSVPASVERFGPRPLGASAHMARRRRSPFDVRFDPAGSRLFFDGDGVLYERREDGLVLVDGYRFEGEELVCDPRTVEIGPRALSLMEGLRRVVLPEGLRRIGDEAFRGSTGLARADLPASVESIGAAAFSCTSLESLRLPARCTHVDDSAFALGPLSSDSVPQPYSSPLRELDVDAANAVFLMQGGVLCKRSHDGALRAMLAPAKSARIELGPNLDAVCDTAFAGTVAVGTLRLADGTRFESAHGARLLCACSIGCVEVPGADEGEGALSLALPRQGAAHPFPADDMPAGTFDAKAFARAYDKALESVADALEQARLAVRRLSSPLYLDDATARRFRSFIESQLAAFCSAIGARGEFQYFELLADAGLLDGKRIASVAESLSGAQGAQAAGYLLDMRRRRFGDASWGEYDL